MTGVQTCALPICLEVASSTPQGLRDLIESDLNLWKKIIRDARISVDVLP